MEPLQCEKVNACARRTLGITFFARRLFVPTEADVTQDREGNVPVNCLRSLGESQRRDFHVRLGVDCLWNLYAHDRAKNSTRTCATRCHTDPASPRNSLSNEDATIIAF